MGRRRSGIGIRKTRSAPKLQRATPVNKPATANATNAPAPAAKPSVMGGIMSGLQNMGFYMMGSSMGRLAGENAVLREMVADNPNATESTPAANACANQLTEFVNCTQKYGDGSMCQQFADALSKCVTMHTPQASADQSMSTSSQFASNNEGFSFN